MTLTNADGTQSHPPPHTPNPSLTQHELRLIRSLQSTAMLTLWNAFTSRAFGNEPTLPHNDIIQSMLGRLLYLRSIDIQIDPLTPWAPQIEYKHSLIYQRIDISPLPPNKSVLWAFILFFCMYVDR